MEKHEELYMISRQEGEIFIFEVVVVIDWKVIGVVLTLRH